MRKNGMEIRNQLAELTYISIYGRKPCVRVFKDSIRAIGLPKFIRFRISADATKLLLEPFDRITLTSFRLPLDFDKNEDSKMEIYSTGLVKELSQRLGWNGCISHRVPGKVYEKQGVIVYDLTKAEEIHYDGGM